MLIICGLGRISIPRTQRTALCSRGDWPCDAASDQERSWMDTGPVISGISSGFWMRARLHSMHPWCREHIRALLCVLCSRDLEYWNQREHVDTRPLKIAYWETALASVPACLSDVKMIDVANQIQKCLSKGSIKRKARVNGQSNERRQVPLFTEATEAGRARGEHHYLSFLRLRVRRE